MCNCSKRCIFVCIYPRGQEWCPSTSLWSVTLRRKCTGLIPPSTAPACPTAATTAASSSIQTPGLLHSGAVVPPTSPPTSPSSSTRLHLHSRPPRGAAALSRHPPPLGLHQQPATSSSRPLPPPPPPPIHTHFIQLPPPPFPGPPTPTATLSPTHTRVGLHPSPCPWQRHPLPCPLHATTRTCGWVLLHARLRM